MTEQLKEALGDQINNPFLLKFSELQSRLECPVHLGKFCYKPGPNPGPNEHVELDAKQLKNWKTTILNGATTLTNPPREPEWEKILAPKPRRRSNGNATGEFNTPGGMPIR